MPDHGLYEVVHPSLPLAPQQDVIVDSTVTILRNYADLPFGSKLAEEEREALLDRVDQAMEGAPDALAYQGFRIASLPPQQAGAFLDQRLITESFHEHGKRGALLLSSGKTLSVMVGGEDHLALRALLPGLQLLRCMTMVCPMEETLSSTSLFAYDTRLGYKTADPLHAGTGLLARTVLHLPALQQSEALPHLAATVEKSGIVLRPLFGTASRTSLHTPSHLYTIENNRSLGRSEEEILSSVEEAAITLATAEREKRDELYKADPLVQQDALSRALAILSSARILPVAEYLCCISAIRLGRALGLAELSFSQIDQMLVSLLSASVAAAFQRPLTEREENLCRADRARRAFSHIQPLLQSTLVDTGTPHP